MCVFVSLCLGVYVFVSVFVCMWTNLSSQSLKIEKIGNSKAALEKSAPKHMAATVEVNQLIVCEFARRLYVFIRAYS